MAGGLEGIQGIAFSAGPHECLETAAIRYVHAVGEEVSQVLSDADVLEHAHRCVRPKLNQDIDVARAPGLITRHRTEQRPVQYPAIAELPLVSAQRCYNLFTVHLSLISETASSFDKVTHIPHACFTRRGPRRWCRFSLCSTGNPREFWMGLRPTARA